MNDRVNHATVTVEEPRRPTRLNVGLVAVGCVLAAVFTFAYYQQQVTWVRHAQERALADIGDIKAIAITAWHRERMADGAGVPLNPAFAGFVREFLAGRASESAEQEIRRYFDLLITNHDYKGAFLFDATGALRLSHPRRSEEPQTPPQVIEALRGKRVVFEDFHREANGTVRLAVIGPICESSGVCVGAIRMEIDPTQFLYPQIQLWPTPSETGETLLIRREGGHVIYLNALRHRRDGAVERRLPLDSPNLPAARVALGFEGVMEGTDYRGVRVLAAGRRVRNTPWSLVTKIDQAEAYSSARVRTAYFGAVAILVVIAAGCAILLAWSRRESEHYQQRIAQREQSERDLLLLNADLEQRVRQRTAELEASNTELEAFSYSVSHDLRAPLRGIDGWSLALLEDYAEKLDPLASEYLGRVRAETCRMNGLIDGLLALSRVTRAHLDRETVDVTTLAETIAGRLRDTHRERRIEFDIMPELRAVADARLLEVALTNLLGNAVKFTSPREAARIEVGQVSRNGQVPFFVRDNGVGFDMAYAEHLFGAFQRLHEASEFPGSGIGLATVQRVISRHGGRVWAEAAPDQGATFYFVLGETAKRVSSTAPDHRERNGREQ